LGNDQHLNTHVERYTADPEALLALQAQFTTSGIPKEPLVTMHTSGDPIVPFWHEPLYRQKVVANGNPYLFNHLPAERYGHCNFTKEEVLKGFKLLVTKVLAKEMLSIPVPVTQNTKSYAENTMH
jgi:hypothetical protein